MRNNLCCLFWFLGNIDYSNWANPDISQPLVTYCLISRAPSCRPTKTSSRHKHVFAKPPECPVLASYQMWYCQKLLKNAKIVKIWPFLWKAKYGSAEIHNFRFLAFLINFWPKIDQKCQKPEVVDFGVFKQFWAKPHLVARLNRTFSTLGRCMSVRPLGSPIARILLKWNIYFLVWRKGPSRPKSHAAENSKKSYIFVI